jgi:hypothetical protein
VSDAARAAPRRGWRIDYSFPSSLPPYSSPSLGHSIRLKRVKKVWKAGFRDLTPLILAFPDPVDRARPGGREAEPPTDRLAVFSRRPLGLRRGRAQSAQTGGPRHRGERMRDNKEKGCWSVTLNGDANISDDVDGAAILAGGRYRHTVVFGLSGRLSPPPHLPRWPQKKAVFDVTHLHLSETPLYFLLHKFG